MAFTTRTIQPKDRLGASQPSRTRIAHMSEDVRSSRAQRDETFSSPHYSGRELNRRRANNKLERKIYGGIAATAIAATGLLAATSNPTGETSPANPNQGAITRQAADNQGLQQAEQADQAARAAATEPTQADIERLQKEQAQLNRPPESK